MTGLLFILLSIIAVNANQCPEVLPGQNRLTLFPKSLFSTTTAPVVPQYPYGGIKNGPYVDINGFSPVDTYGNKYIPYPAPTSSSPADIISTATAQVDVCQLLLEREFAAGSLDWKTDWMHANLGTPVIPSTPGLNNAVVQAIGAYASQVAIKPTLTNIGTGPLTGSSLSGFFLLLVPKAFDSGFATGVQQKYGCSMPRRAISSSLCPTIGGGAWSQARVDWNIFRTSTITPLVSHNNITIDLHNEFLCLKALLSQAGGSFRNTMAMRFSIQGIDATGSLEREFLKAYAHELANFPNGWKPTMMLEKGVTLSDLNAAIAVSIEEAFIGTDSDSLPTAYNNNLVFSLSDITNQVVATGAGWTSVGQIFGTTSKISTVAQNAVTPPTLANNGPDFYSYISRYDPAFVAAVTPFIPGGIPGQILAQWTGQGVQALTNMATSVAELGIDISDITYIYSIGGPFGGILPFFTFADAIVTLLNGTEGHSGFTPPQRDDSTIVALPAYGGALPGVYSYYGAVVSFRGKFFNRGDYAAPANNDGATLGVTKYQICNGHTDITTCPPSLRVNLGAEFQAINAFYPSSP
jgi:hypothetical protein